MSQPIEIFTIGFTQKNAQDFFEILIKAGVRRVIDTRLNNVSQLAGFTKKSDLEYFLRKISDIEYVHLLEFAPTKDILDTYKKKGGDWGIYKNKFLQLMKDRKVEKNTSPRLLDGGCLLCSEPTPHHCHRRLVAEYLRDKWKNVKI